VNVAERVELIRELCGFEGQRSGTDAERRAANAVAERLRSPKRRVRVEPIHVHPQLGFIYALHCIAAVAASLVALLVPIAGFAALLAVAALLYLDVNGRLYVLRLLLFRRASQNVISSGAVEKADATVVICAHIDEGRAGAIYWARSIRALLSVARRLRIPTGPFQLLLALIAFGLIPLGLRAAEIDGIWVDALQFVQIVGLLLAVFLLIDLELAGIGPGANDNASGVATAVSLAAVLDADPPSRLAVWVVITGGEEPTQEGMRAFLRAHRNQLDRRSTYFINVDAVGRGTLHYETRAGWIVGYPMGGRLAELCEAIADTELDDAEELSDLTRPLRRSTAGDSLPPRLAGYQALTLTCRDEQGQVPALRTFGDEPNAIDSAALERAHAFGLELARALDRDLARR